MVIEDDFEISRIISESLTKEGFKAKGIIDFSKVMETFIAFAPELVLMDINLPGESGFYWCEKIRALSNKELILNLDNGMIFCEDRQESLTHNEKEILKLLIKNQGKSVSRERIIRSLWNDERFIDDNTLTVNITRLRKKLSDIGCEQMIKTVRNEGYMI